MSYAINTVDVSTIGQYSATTGGSGIDASGAEIYSRGIVMVEGDASAYYPDDRVYELLDGSTGDFSTTLDLEPSSNYTVRAYLHTLVGDDYTTTYGDNKNFNTLELGPIYQTVCLGCYWYNKLLNPTTGEITALTKDPSTEWQCAAFNNDSSVKYIPEDVKLGTNVHDVSIAGQLYDSYDDYYPTYTSRYVEGFDTPFTRVFAPTGVWNGEFIATQDDANQFPLTDIRIGAKYLIGAPNLIEGTNVTFAETTMDTSSRTITTDITINAAPENATKTSSSDGSLGEMAFDSNYLYVCIGANSWKKIELVSI